ncbi:MAG: TolC family protein, partial [Terriglobales bacterium]
PSAACGPAPRACIFSWEVADFGRRAANIRFFRELARQAADQSDVVRLEVGAHAADAYLTVLAAREQVRVTSADVARWQGLAAVVHALVAQQLRPGADDSRAQAELAAARIRASAAQRDLEQAQGSLTEALGLPPGAPLPPLAPLPASALPAAPPPPLSAPPQARVHVDAVAAATAHQQEIARSALPRFYALGTAFGRGSGVLAAGKFATGAAGLTPDTAANWAVGLSVDFSFTRWFANRAQKTEAAAQLKYQQEQQRAGGNALALARARATADWNEARTVAQESPIGLAAAQAGEAQARVRYQTGLASLVDWANSEQLLLQADSDNALSQLQLWRALVEAAFASGSLQPVLAAAGH